MHCSQNRSFFAQFIPSRCSEAGLRKTKEQALSEMKDSARHLSIGLA